MTIALWLAVIDALLVIPASVAGILWQRVYARETVSSALQGIAQDSVNLVAVIVLLISVYFVRKGSFRAYLVWCGVLLYLLYTYVIYTFDVHYNSLFLVYVAILGLSFYALVISVIQGNLAGLQTAFSVRVPARLVSGFLLVLGVVFYLLWLREEIPALLGGTIPPSVTEANLPTNPVHILDLGFFLPAILITAVLLWRKKLVGYLLAGPLLVFSALTATGILTIFLVMGSKGMTTSIGIEAVFVLVIVVSVALSRHYIWAVQESLPR